MDIAKYIKQSAANGLSRTTVREALGYSRDRFEAVLEVVGPVSWPAPNKDLSHQLYYQRLKGTVPPQLREGMKKAWQKKRDDGTYTVRGESGLIRELIERFGLKVTDSTVRKRMRKGMQLEQALFTPTIPVNQRRRTRIADLSCKQSAVTP